MAADLFISVQEAGRINRESNQNRLEALIKEVQVTLKRDDIEWKQIKNQVHYKLHCLRNLDYIDNFTDDLDELSKAIDIEAEERETDDLEIIELVNNVC